DDEIEPDTMRIDPAVAKRRSDHLAALRAQRDAAAVDDVLTRIRAAAHSSENMMPLLVEAAELYVTIGEICGVLREEWGEYQEVVTI
ncbi:MAG: methylmalonyl-CoA mutase family protein, partial [Dehalococcoidia bacterium]